MLVEPATIPAVRRPNAWIPAAAYIFACAALFPYYRYLIGSDGVSYISIANHYLVGDWRDAVNAYWGPLYSWLLAIPIALGAGGVLAMRIVCFVAGLATLCAFARLARKFELTLKMESICLWIAAAMIFAFTLRDQPDLLVAAFLLSYFGWIFDSRYAADRTAGLWCGLMGALAYLTKSYGFFFFLASFTILNAVHWLRAGHNRKFAVLRNLFLGYAVFALIAGSWIAILSNKYAHPTIGTTGEFNFRLVGPESQGYPQFSHLLDPPNPRAISFWEDPSPAALPSWNPLSSSGMRHQAVLLWTNFKALLYDWQEASLLSIGFLFAYCLWGMSISRARIPWILVVLAILIYPAGYVLLTLQDRYLWPEIFLFLLIGGVITGAVDSSRWASRAARQTLLAAFVISFLLLPLRLIVGSRDSGRSIYQTSRQIAAHYPIHGNFAACGDWNDSLYLAYYLNSRFLGDTGMTAEELTNGQFLNPSLTTTPAALSDQEAAAQLISHNADFYLAWKACLLIPTSVASHEDITHGDLLGLKIYSLH